MTSTLRQLFAKYVAELTSAGIDQAEAEIELILCHLLGIDRLKLYLDGDTLLTEEVLRRFEEIIERRKTRYPLQYILDESWFYGRRFFVSPAVMVPTPETELLVETVIRLVTKRQWACPRILDIGVGSGVISVTLANELDDCRITGLDVSKEALAVAGRNADSLGGGSKIDLRESDFFSSVKADERFDLIVSNPPYIREGDYPGLPPEVLEDPKISLTAGEDGLDAIRVILREGPRFLAPGGRILFEIGEDQADLVGELTAEDERYTTITILRDLNDRDRVVMLGCD